MLYPTKGKDKLDNATGEIRINYPQSIYEGRVKEGYMIMYNAKNTYIYVYRTSQANELTSQGILTKSE